MFFILSDAKDTRYTTGGLFFTECLRAEYREIRKAMERLSQTETIAGRDEGTANGLSIQKPTLVRVNGKDLYFVGAAD